MSAIAIYTITSSLHDEKAVAEVSDAFLSSLGVDYTFCGSDFSTFGQFPLPLIYVRTGGAEGIFKALFPKIRAQYEGPLYLLTSGKSNSLAASLEILSWLRQQGIAGEVLHGRSEALGARISLLAKVASARKALRGSRIGVVGKPSDWLISSSISAPVVKEKWGVEVLDVPMEELEAAVRRAPGEEAPANLPMKRDIRKNWPGALQIYQGLEEIRQKYDLQALTLRCFDLLSSVGNTGCIALARMNEKGIPASCEGDIPALLSMMLSQALTGCPGFQANPSQIDAQTGEILFAHCTISLGIPRSVQYDTHFESGIGVGIHGDFPEGPVTVLKLSGDLGRFFVAEGELEANQYEENLCRTQVRVRLSPEEARYFLTNPIGNHHIIVPGHHKALVEAFMEV